MASLNYSPYVRSEEKTKTLQNFIIANAWERNQME
jgi:hypothetical protein